MKTVRIFKRRGGGYEFEDFICTAAIEEGQKNEGSGARRKNSGSVRIMTGRDIGIRPGDYAAFSEKKTQPDKNTDYMITAVRDNRRGSIPHWRLIIDGGV